MKKFWLTVSFCASWIIGCGVAAAGEPPESTYQVAKIQSPYIALIVIPKEHRNEKALRRLAETLRKDYAQEPDYTILIFDDQRAIDLRKDGNPPPAKTKDGNFHRKHYIASYNKNSSSGLHEFAFGTSDRGFSGKATLIKFR